MLSDHEQPMSIDELIDIMRTERDQALARLEDVTADADNDRAHLQSLKRGMQALRDISAEFGIDSQLPWPEWLAAIRERLSASSS